MSVEERYKKAYKEIFFILSISPDYVWNKIPDEKIKFYFENMDRNYNFYISNIKDIELMHETKSILANLYIKYLANDEQIKRIYMNDIILLKKKEEEYQAKLEKSFKINKSNNEQREFKKQPVKVKYNFFQKILRRIKSIFVKNS